jgi:hypothetical protein
MTARNSPQPVPGYVVDQRRCLASHGLSRSPIQYLIVSIYGCP